MDHKVGTWVVLCCAVMASRPGTAAAQQRSGVQVRLNPSLGVSLPFGGTFIDEANLKKHSVTSAILAARLGVTVVPHLGFEGHVAVGRGLVAIRDSLNRVSDHPATVLLGSLKGVLSFNPNTPDVAIHVSSGVGLITRGGPAWADTRPQSVVPAWVIAIGGTSKITRRGPLAFRFELEDFISSARFNVGLATETRPVLHHDLIWSLGFIFPILGARRS